VLTHEIHEIGKLPETSKENPRAEIEEKMNKVHIFRMKTVERDYAQNKDEFDKS
jgi:hypothetical protein